MLSPNAAYVRDEKSTFCGFSVSDKLESSLEDSLNRPSDEKTAKIKGRIPT